jgi:beta-N-acetylhexosaminidase
MAIGSTYLDHGVSFATKTSTVIAKELAALGFNNNYAPVIDVNTNPDNPVINTRSYGETPRHVAELGVAAVNGFQQNGVMATLKHFPGHGDTHIDSHLGLPVVAHDLATIKKQDLAPFQWAIDHSKPAMIMTAHIQYPALDDSTVVNNDGENIIRPATMSRKILTDLLRDKMGYDGIIATDALDMAGIAHYFDEVTAVVETFVAGADLAVMPYKIRKVEDIEKFYQFIKDVAQGLRQKIDNKELLSTELTQSFERINRYKEQYCQLPRISITKQVALAEQLIAQPEHLKLEQKLIENAVVQLKTKTNVLPVTVADIERIHLFVLDWQEFGALKNAITNQWQRAGKIAPEVSATVVAQGDTQAQLQSGDKLAKADLVIATVDTKIASAVTSVVDSGGVEDLLTQVMSMANEQDKVDYKLLLSYQLQQAQKQHIPSVLIAKGSPYLLGPYLDLASTILINFDDHIYEKVYENSMKTQRYSSGYVASMAIIFGEKQVEGKLPVSL